MVTMVALARERPSLLPGEREAPLDGDFFNSLFHGVSLNSGILPRPNEVSTGHFVTSASLRPAFRIPPSPPIKTPPLQAAFLLAEKEGFEPSIPFWGIHDFQSCALDQLRDFSIQLSPRPGQGRWRRLTQSARLSYTRWGKMSRAFFKNREIFSGRTAPQQRRRLPPGRIGAPSGSTVHTRATGPGRSPGCFDSRRTGVFYGDSGCRPA